MPSNIELLTHRLNRLYAGLKRTAPISIDAIPLQVWRTDKFLRVLHDFSGGQSPDDIRDALTQIVHHIAHVKDPLKKHLGEKANGPSKVERFINGSAALKVVIDIANREKHGYPSDHPSRSGHDPFLGDVGRSLRLKTGGEKGSSATYTIDSQTGKPHIVTTGGGSGTVEYWGDVRGKNSARLGDILDFCNDAIADWERLFGDLGISVI